MCREATYQNELNSEEISEDYEIDVDQTSTVRGLSIFQNLESDGIQHIILLYYELEASEVLQGWE